MNNKLFGGSDDSDDDFNLTTNEAYAKSYNKIRQKELQKKFKDRGIAVSDSETSSDSDSSSDAEVQDVKFDQEFFKTLASLKSKDPKIYDKNTKFFENIQSDNDYDDGDDDNDVNEDKNNNKDETNEFQRQKSKIKKDKKRKALTLKDYERKIILENNGKFEDDSENEGDVIRSMSPTAVEAERSLKAEIINVLNEDVDSEEEGFGGIFKKRVKSKEQEEQEEADYAKWLAGKQEEILEEDKKKLEPLKNYWQSNNLSQSEQFLRDYILNKGYVESNSSDIPTYEEIIGDVAPLSEDEVELEKQDEFEHKYNFRFEEPDSEFITRYPRTIQQSVRRVDDKRKQKRLEIKERKQKEKQQKMKEIEILKELKRKEIEEKIKKLKMVTGNDELGFKDEELDGDFDPEEHDKRMKEIFNDEYYQVNEGDDKPECPSDIEDLKTEDWDNYIPGNNVDHNIQDDYEPHCEDDDFNMDCDYDPAAAKEQLQKELIENTKSRRNRKGRKSRFRQMIETKKPAFKPEDEKTYAEYIDEYYKLDCEDIIGDIPCRFKYVETIPNDFGLTIEEILLAKNKELNQWASLKKAVQIRPDNVEKREQRLYKLKARNEELKRKIFKSLYGEGSDEESDDNEKPSNKSALNINGSDNINNKNNDNSMKESKQKRKRKLQKNESEMDERTNKIPKPIAPSDNAGEDNVEFATKTETTVYSNNKNDDKFEKEPKKQNRKLQKIAPETNGASDKNPNENSTEVSKKSNKVDDNLVGKTLDTCAQATSIPGDMNAIKKKKKNKKIKAKASTTPTPQSNNVKSINSSEINFKSKKQKQLLPSVVTKNKSDSINEAVKSKHKFNRHRRISNGHNKSSDTNISDERLKAYGINPKKFHKKKKYARGK